MFVVITVIFIIFFYAYIYYPSVEVPILIDEVNENAPESYEKPSKFENTLSVKEGGHLGLEDAITFTFNRNQPQVMQRFFLDYHGMNDMKALEASLKKQDYISVLKALWSEKDAAKRLDWLSQKENESHTILLFELALELFKNNPNLENLHKSLFLIELGKYRADIDAICINDPSMKTASQSLYVNYATAIGSIVSQTPELIGILREDSKNELTKEILQNVLDKLNQIENDIDKLPSSNWISDYALKRLFSNENILESPEVCKKKKIELIELIKSEIVTQLRVLSNPNQKVNQTHLRE